MSDIKLFPCRFCGEIPVIEQVAYDREPFTWVKLIKPDKCNYLRDLKLLYQQINEFIKIEQVTEFWNARNEKYNPFLAIKIRKIQSPPTKGRISVREARKAAKNVSVGIFSLYHTEGHDNVSIGNNKIGTEAKDER
jgi:hypothetical protein